MKTPLPDLLLISALVPLFYIVVTIAFPHPASDHTPLRSTFPATVAQPRDCR
jgi:hypothetical protein